MEHADYFWQGDCTVLRPLRPDDWEVAYQGYLDSSARRAFFADGQHFDDILFGMTREEFDEIQGRL
jgi:hypothetical protein